MRDDRSRNEAGRSLTWGQGQAQGQAQGLAQGLAQLLGAAAGGLTEALSSGTRALLLLPIRVYRRFLSRLKPVPTCRFTPTCSAYAEEALRTHGVLRAVGLVTWRLLRCQPFARAGYDPVPPPPGSTSTPDVSSASHTSAHPDHRH